MTSRLESLQNLRSIGKLKSEPPAQSEFNALLSSAANKLKDAENSTLMGSKQARDTAPKLFWHC